MHHSADRDQLAVEQRPASACARVRPLRIAAASSAATSTAGRNGSASAAGRIRSSSASSTEKRPDLDAPQRPAVAAERVGDRADVRAGADPQVEPAPFRPA